MAVDNFFVAVGVDDWYSGNLIPVTSGTVTIVTHNLQTVPPSPPGSTATAFADVDTSGLPDDAVISSATVSHNESAYTATRGLAKTYHISIWTGSTWRIMAAYTFGRSAVGRTTTLDATDITHISLTGKTSFRVLITGVVSTGQFKSYSTLAYETSQAQAIRMTITYTVPSGFIPKVIII